jgi:hypothetical protein
MIAQAARRLPALAWPRVRLEQADALTAGLDPAGYDAVVTLFFLDCFTPLQVERLLDRVSAACHPNARWLFADFVLPAGGWRRARARFWLALLYGFFRWQTELTARALPPSEALLRSAGWRAAERCDFQAGLLRTVLFERRPPPGGVLLAQPSRPPI